MVDVCVFVSLHKYSWPGKSKNSFFSFKMARKRNDLKTPDWQKSIGELYGAAEKKPGASAGAAIKGLGLSVNVRKDQAERDVSSPVSLRAAAPHASIVHPFLRLHRPRA